MSRRRTPLLPWITLALVTAVALPATADEGAAGKAATETSAPSAQDLYSAAQKLFDKGSYAEALVAFRQAYNVSGSPNARLMIGQCHLGLGRSADAYEEMAATLKEAEARAASDPKYGPTRDAAAAQIALLEPIVGKVVIEVAGAEGARVTLNGAVVPGERLGATMAVDPGAVLVQGTLEDGRTARAQRTVKAGETRKIELRFAPKMDSSEPRPGPVPPPIEDPPSSGGSVRTAGFIVGGIGVAGVVVFGVTAAMAQGKFSQLETECAGQRCTDPKLSGVVDEGKTLQTVSTVGLVAGIAGITAGAAMIIFGGPKRRPAPAPGSTGGTPRSSSPPREIVSLSPAGAGLRCTVTF